MWRSYISSYSAWLARRSCMVRMSVAERETREGWPLLSVETEANGDSKITNESGPSLVGSLVSSCRYKRFLSCLDCSSRPSTKYFFFLIVYTFFNSFFPIAQQAGRAVVQGRLSLNVYLWSVGHPGAGIGSLFSCAKVTKKLGDNGIVVFAGVGTDIG
jgi:hypothetical protein